MKRFCFCSLCFHLNVLHFPPLTGGCSESLGAFGSTFKCHVVALYSTYSPCNSILLLPCVIVYYIVLFYCIFLCPCMAINVSVQYNGGLLPDIVMVLTQGYFHLGTRQYAMKRFCFCSLCFHLNVLHFAPRDWGMLRRSTRVLIYLFIPCSGFIQYL